MIIIIKFNRRLKKKILITGGLGFIGSHTSLKLLDSNYEIIILDNLSNSKIKVIKKIKKLAKKDFKFIEGDIRDRKLLRQLFKNNLVDSVIHFAGLKAAGESEKYPLDYYENNVFGSMVLLQEMKKANVKSIIFSSSASVYGNAQNVKCKEDTQLNPISVYGKTKLIIEDMLKSIYKSSPEWKIINLRYFNPIGAHSTGIIGEDFRNKPTNLIPFITDVALGKKDQLLVFGNDYNTNDGTGKRDYIHIEDLAIGHLFALEKLSKEINICRDINLGTGKSYSVIEVIKAFESASGEKIPYQIIERREGDIAEICADPTFALNFLGWEAKFDLERMCVDSWRWKVMNPNGY